MKPHDVEKFNLLLEALRVLVKDKDSDARKIVREKLILEVKYMC